MLLAGDVHAEDGAGDWSAAARTSYAWLGPRERPTGGLMITGSLMRSIGLGRNSEVAVGAEGAAFGFDSGGRWTAILGGLVAVVRTEVPLTRAWLVGVGVHLDGGRLPVCNAWGLCLQYAGLFPAASAGVRYEASERVAFDLGGGARWVRTLAWSGAAGEGNFSGAVYF